MHLPFPCPSLSHSQSLTRGPGTRLSQLTSLKSNSRWLLLYTHLISIWDLIPLSQATWLQHTHKFNRCETEVIIPPPARFLLSASWCLQHTPCSSAVLWSNQSEPSKSHFVNTLDSSVLCQTPFSLLDFHPTHLHWENVTVLNRNLWPALLSLTFIYTPLAGKALQRVELFPRMSVLSGSESSLNQILFHCLVLRPLMQVPMAISWHGKKVERKLSPCTGWPHITTSQLRTLIPRNSLHKHGSLLKTTFLIILQPLQLLKSPPHQKYTDFWETNSNHSTEFKVLHIFLSRIMLHSRSPLLFY